MKIIHLGHVPPPADHPQRENMARLHPGRWVLNHAIAQKEAGMDVEVVTQAHKATADFVCEIEGVRVHFLRSYHSFRHLVFYAVDQVRMARYAKKLKPAIIHAHGTEAMYAMAAIRTGLPFCVTAQGLMFQIIPTLSPGAHIGLRFLRLAEHYAWRRTRFAVAKSEYVRDGLREEYPHLDLTLIHNTYAKALDAPLREKRGRAFAFVGGFNERKGVHLLSAALREVAREHPDVELHTLGNPPEAGAAGYAGEQMGALRDILGDRLHLHGVVPAEEVFSVLDDCVAILVPSLEEMFGNQVIEGIMRGCHAIVMDGCGPAQNVRRLGNGSIFGVGDVSEFARLIAATLSAPPSAAVMEAAREAVRREMSPSAVAGRHRALYERILSGG